MDCMKKKAMIDWKKLQVKATHVPKVKKPTLVKLCDFVLAHGLGDFTLGGAGHGLKQPSPYG